MPRTKAPTPPAPAPTPPPAPHYKVASTATPNIWIETVSGESFGVSDTPAYRAFRAWLDAGNTPDPPQIIPGSDVLPRAQRLKTLVQSTKAAMASGPQTVAGLASALSSFLDGLAALDNS